MDHIHSSHRLLRSLHHWELYQNLLPDPRSSRISPNVLGGISKGNITRSLVMVVLKMKSLFDFGVSPCYQMRLFVSVSCSNVFTVCSFVQLLLDQKSHYKAF
jgi:hypothetical protein